MKTSGKAYAERSIAHARMWVYRLPERPIHGARAYVGDPFAEACVSARCRVVFLSSVIVDLCSRWTRYVRNVAQQLTLDEQFVDAAMPNVKRSLAMQ